MALYGDLFMKGEHVAQNYQTARSYYEKCKETNAIAQDALGHIFEHGFGGIEIDVPRAFECFRRSAGRSRLRSFLASNKAGKRKLLKCFEKEHRMNVG